MPIREDSGFNTPYAAFRERLTHSLESDIDPQSTAQTLLKRSLDRAQEARTIKHRVADEEPDAADAASLHEAQTDEDRARTSEESSASPRQAMIGRVVPRSLPRILTTNEPPEMIVRSEKNKRAADDDGLAPERARKATANAATTGMNLPASPQEAIESTTATRLILQGQRAGVPVWADMQVTLYKFRTPAQD
ncbi:hypothetical protein LTR17_000559 [Elasticomyces elasticus]|nr:hypothetical protein LTR17_000559 [Elasticomyces elasticus]